MLSFDVKIVGELWRPLARQCDKLWSLLHQPVIYQPSSYADSQSAAVLLTADLGEGSEQGKVRYIGLEYERNKPQISTLPTVMRPHRVCLADLNKVPDRSGGEPGAVSPAWSGYQSSAGSSTNIEVDNEINIKNKI